MKRAHLFAPHSGEKTFVGEGQRCLVYGHALRHKLRELLYRVVIPLDGVPCGFVYRSGDRERKHLLKFPHGVFGVGSEQSVFRCNFGYRRIIFRYSVKLGLYDFHFVERIAEPERCPGVRLADLFHGSIGKYAYVFAVVGLENLVGCKSLLGKVYRAPLRKTVAF